MLLSANWYGLLDPLKVAFIKQTACCGGSGTKQAHLQDCPVKQAHPQDCPVKQDGIFQSHAPPNLEPKVELFLFECGWPVTATTCEHPHITFASYKHK